MDRTLAHKIKYSGLNPGPSKHFSLQILMIYIDTEFKNCISSNAFSKNTQHPRKDYKI